MECWSPREKEREFKAIFNNCSAEMEGLQAPVASSVCFYTNHPVHSYSCLSLLFDSLFPESFSTIKKPAASTSLELPVFNALCYFPANTNI
jgi:hypothetical protein